jgi:hypothetical protein
MPEPRPSALPDRSPQQVPGVLSLQPFLAHASSDPAAICVSVPPSTPLSIRPNAHPNLLGWRDSPQFLSIPLLARSSKHRMRNRCGQNKLVARSGRTNYHRTVSSVLTVCVTSGGRRSSLSVSYGICGAAAKKGLCDPIGARDPGRGASFGCAGVGFAHDVSCTNRLRLASDSDDSNCAARGPHEPFYAVWVACENRGCLPEGCRHHNGVNDIRRFRHA